MGAKLLLDEYVRGTDPKRNGMPKRTKEEEKILEKIKMKMTDHYHWHENQSFLFVASQNCSDMLVHVGKSI